MRGNSRAIEEHERVALEIVSGLTLDSSVTWDELVAQMEAIYGKPIVLIAVEDRDWGAVTGLFLDTEDRGLIYYRAEHSLVYQVHNIYHEFGHVLLRDRGCRLSEGVRKDDVFTLGLREEFQRAYANGVVFDKPELVANEQTAEAIAYLIAKHRRAKPTTVQTEVFG
jgi:hypothetical protein